MTPRRLQSALALILALATSAAVQTTAATAPVPLPFSEADAAECRILDRLLASDHWPFRVFALLRLERYSGDGANDLVRPRLADESWAVRAFAIRTSVVLGRPPTVDDLAAETDGRVARTALRYGVTLPAERVERGTRKLLRTREIDDLLLGLEIASYCTDEALRAEGNRRALQLIRNMDESLIVRVGPRLGRCLDVESIPVGGAAWREWLGQRGGRELLGPPPPAPRRHGGGRPIPGLVAELPPEGFARLVNYLDALRQRDLDLVIVMDATMSMTPMLVEARAGVESLILFLDDVSRSLRLAFVAYRDHDNEPVWEGHPFTREVESIRDFLFGIRITGGRDLPEAVFEGLDACRQLDWNRSATREIILVGDARPHDNDGYRLTSLLESYTEHDVTVHAVHVPMEANLRSLGAMSPAAAAAYRQEIAEHNTRTEAAFRQIAELGDGDAITLRDADDLVPSIMRLTLEETWWPVFDEFYTRYLELCR